jgi:hypothetical protein
MLEDQTVDPLQRKREADLLLDEGAARLKELLRSACVQLEPFPVFPGTLGVQAVECEPPKGAGPERGCVVVMQDGELYELEIGFDVNELSDQIVPDPFYARREKVTKLEDLHPLDAIAYSYNGLREVTRLLLERGVRGL